MTKTFANGLSIVHKGDGHTQVCSIPDVCKTPSPGGPVPVPYINIARDADLASGSTSVKIEANPIALSNSNLSTSTGDEPGTAGGGLISSKTKGKLTWGSSSIDVKVEGKGVVRFLDVTQHNGNSFNSALLNLGQGYTGQIYGDDVPECPNCKQSTKTHRVLEHDDSKALALQLSKALESRGEDALKPDDNGDRTGGYMIGVLICQSGKKYAAASGLEPPAFEAAANQVGLTPCTFGLGELENPGNIRNFGLKRVVSKDPLVIKEFKVLRHKLKQIAGGRPALICAAPKLLQRALRDGERPYYMTEIFFDPYLKTTSQYKHNETAASCKTCEIQVPLMLCTVDNEYPGDP
ncbi:MAG TPA: DUF4150 domain-containing protein [Archangium sp.]|nr:DUF4150 domain-containing protein [Archangium sp.]